MQPFNARVALALLLALPCASAQEETNAPDSVPALVKTLKELRDDADVDVVKKLANKKTRESMEALLSVYDVMQSTYMRRAVCQGLALYDDVAGAEQPALEKLMNVATESPERELRISAIELLGGCDAYGRTFLRMIVESSADDEVREQAMQHHVAGAQPGDMEWYRGIYELRDPDKEGRQSRKSDEEQPKVPHTLPRVRLLAFEALKGDLSTEEIVKAVSDPQEKVRAAALKELDQRGDKDLVPAAEKLYQNVNVKASTRLAAAGIIIKHLGAEAADDFIEDATKSDAGRELSFGLADLLVQLNDEEVNKKLQKGVGKGEGTELLFYLRATAHLDDPKISKTLAKLLKDKDPGVQAAAADLLGERKAREELPDLEKLIDKSEDPLVISAALVAITRIRTNDAEWEQALLAYAASPERDVRNAAIEALGRTKDPDNLPTVVQALQHEDWSTRLSAMRAVEHMRLPEGVGALCQRIGSEEGRMQVEFSETLFRLTGKPYGQNARQWEEWWKNEGAGFQPVDEEKLRQLEQEGEARRLKSVSRSEFFGIRIESHRVIFVLDVSGSMNEALRGQYVGEKGELRIDVAKRELLKAIDSLDRNTFFNIVTFSTAVRPWRDRIAEKTEEVVVEAKTFVNRLGADGGTNLFGSLELAFNDPDVDTIYVLSDGEPSVGTETDQLGIRQRVAEWNKHRGIVIHSIAVGGSFDVLEWLAQDTGGTYVKFP